MQVTTEKYKAAVYSSNVVKSTITGRITTVNGVVYELNDDDIIPGSLSVNNKCVNGNSFEFGAVFQGELNVTLINTNIDRYEIKDAIIDFTEQRMLPDQTIESVVIGRYTIADPSRSKRLITIKAVDFMDYLDIDLQETAVGTPFELLTVVSEKCGVLLKQTEKEITAMPNGSRMFSAYADTTQTYRDMVSFIAMMLGAFAFIDVDGRLSLKQYSLSTDMEIHEDNRSGTIVQDYETYYKGVTARFIANENYAPYEYIDETIEEGLILDLGDIPIVRGLQETKHEMLFSLFAYIKQIRYVPVSFTLLISDAALQLGDRLLIGGEDVETYITGYTWKYHGSESLKGVGDNPRLKATDKASRRLSTMEDSINAKTVVVHTYTNIQNLNINGTKETEVINFNFSAIDNATVIMFATVPLAMSADGNITLHYYYDGVFQEGDSITKYLSKGSHFVTFVTNLFLQKDKRMTLTVKAVTSYIESSTRKQEAKIASFENFVKSVQNQSTAYTEVPINVTVPTASIAKNQIKAVLYAQGLAGTKAWDGTISINESIKPLTIVPVINPISDVPKFYFTSGESVISDVVSKLFIKPNILGISGEASFNRVIKNWILETKRTDLNLSTYYIDVSNATFKLQNSYTFEGNEMDIDFGKLYEIATDTEQFVKVTNIEIV